MDPIKLQYPVDAANRRWEEIPAPRRPKAADSVATYDAKNDAEREVGLLARLCDVPREVILELDMVDYSALQERLKGFLSPSRKS